MKMKLLCAVAALGFAGVSQVAFADDAPAPTPEFTVTGTAAVVSQYRFRGISQSNNNPAFQGSITLTDKSGFYLATWGSSTSDNGSAIADGPGADSFYSGSPIGPGGTEIDVYGGWSHGYKNGVTVDGGVYGYLYPNAPVNNYFEVYGDLSKAFGPVGAKVGVNWAPKQAAFDSYATHYSMYEYFELTYSPPKFSALTVHGHIGHTGGAENYVKEYMDYTAGVSYKWKALTFDVSAVGTNISKSDIANTGACTYTVEPVESDFRIDEAAESAVDGNCVNFYKRPAKSVAVFSITASF